MNYIRPHNESNKTYKAYEETVFQQGRCIAYQYVQDISQAFPKRKAFFYSTTKMIN